MDSTSPEISRQAGLEIVTRMINHRGEVGPEFHKELEDFVKPLFQQIKAVARGAVVRRRATAGLFCAAFQHLVETLGLPAQSCRQGFECAAAMAAFDGMPLDLPHDGHRHVRGPRKLALRPAQLADTIADHPRDRSPVLRIAFRHAFLRAPLPAPRVADPDAIPRQTETNRNQTTSIRKNYQAEISATSVISAPVMAVRPLAIPQTAQGASES
jgi:hypothetical protein